MPSSMVGLETVLGDDETVEFEDFLGGTPNIPHTINVRRVQIVGRVFCQPDQDDSLSKA